jgi:uncharacterized membrane protein
MAGKKADEKITTPVEKPKEVPKEAPKPASSNDDGIFAALCYILGIIVPLFILFTEKKQNKFLAFHAWQSLIFSVIWFVVFFIGAIGITVISFVTMGFGGILSCFFLPVALVVFCAMLFVAYKAYLGEKYKLPIIGDMAEKQAEK